MEPAGTLGVLNKIDTFEFGVASDAETEGLLKCNAQNQGDDERVDSNCNNAEGLLASRSKPPP